MDYGQGDVVRGKCMRASVESAHVPSRRLGSSCPGTSQLCPIMQVPVFVRWGAVIPMLPRNLTSVPGVSAQQFSDIVWQLWPGGGVGTLYEDDGISTEYLTGTYAVTTLSAEPVGTDCKDISITTQVTGSSVSLLVGNLRRPATRVCYLGMLSCRMCMRVCRGRTLAWLPHGCTQCSWWGGALSPSVP